MRAMLDACVLYPTVLREILTGLAARGLFTPLWSERVLEEWARAAARNDPELEPLARAEIALLRSRWPEAAVHHDPDAEAGLHLPDDNDRHVLAAALEGGAEAIVTANLRDFPARRIGVHGLRVLSPDALLLELLAEAPESVGEAVEEVRARTEAVAGREIALRWLLKRAGLPRSAKRLAPAA